MERELFRLCKVHLRALGRRREDRRFAYTDAAVLEVYLWAVINDRPTSWACRPQSWPPGLRRGPLPSQSQVSRRLREPSVIALADRLEHRVLHSGNLPLLVMLIDGKPLPIAGHSADKDAGYGRAAGGKAKGYKLHALIDMAGTPWAWRIEPMNVDERTVALQLLEQVPGPGYLLADRNYDSNKLFAAADQAQVQMVVPRRYGPERELGHREHHAARLRSRELLEHGENRFGPELYELRRAVERFFANLSNYGGGLTCLPAWVRTRRRVTAWVQAKLVLRGLRTTLIQHVQEAA